MAADAADRAVAGRQRDASAAGDATVDVGGGIRIAYRVDGDPAAPPLLLLMGLGCQLVHWDQRLVEQFVDRGFRVIRCDHRDIGESTHLALPVPDVRRAVVRGLLGGRVDAPYRLADMAADVDALLAHLGVRRAHVAGVSMGGMIAQRLAIAYPARVASLTSIMSTTGRRRYLPTWRALRALLSPPARDEAAFVEAMVRTFAIIGSQRLARDEAALRATAAAAWRRGSHPAGVARQLVAVLADGDRTAALARLRCPTLVIHGTDDPLIPIAAGRATARAVPGAWWLPIEGMGHDLPTAAWHPIVEAMSAIAARA